MKSKRPENLTRLILKIPHTSCNPKARTEIHSLTGHRHLFMYIAAVKSLLRFHSDIAIVSHSDGTLTERDVRLLDENIRGIRIIDRNDADRKINRTLKRFPNCKKYRAANIISMQLLDYALLSKADKIVSLDSDILFLRRPNKLIDWIINKRREIVYSYEVRPYGQATFLSERNCDFPPHVSAGFICFYKQMIALNKIERILSGMKCFSWFTTQNILPLLMKDKSRDYKISFFDPKKYQFPYCFKDGAIFRHYWSSVCIADKYVGDLMKVIIEINKARERVPYVRTQRMKGLRRKWTYDS